MSKLRGIVWLSMLWALVVARARAAEEIVQIPVEPLLDGRPVTTLTNGALVPWTQGLDRDDGFITSAAAAFLKQTSSALPDDATFAANAEHPQMVLHFANTAPAQSAQARGVAGVGTFDIDVPHAAYSGLFLAILSSYGDCPLMFTLQYTDASKSQVQFTLPDWGTGKPLPKDPPVFFNLIAGLHKWNKDNASVDTPSHALTGLRLQPAADKQLSRVQVSKTSATPYLVFFGATGVATSAIDSGGSSGTAGSGGSSGSSGTTGSAAGAGGAPFASGGGAGLGGASAGMSGSGGASAVAVAGAPAATGGGGTLAGAPGLASPENNAGCSFAAQRGRPEVAWLFALFGSCVCLSRRARLSSRR